MKRYYSYDPATGESACLIADKLCTHCGIAVCHPEDEPFKSERVGLSIAEARAEIAALKHLWKNELLPGLKALSHLQTNIKTSKFYNPKSYEARMLRRQVAIKEAEINAVKQEIDVIQASLDAYLKARDEYNSKRLQDKKD